jgi:hypothetical protein
MARTEENLDRLLQTVTPTIEAVGQWIQSMAPDECGVEFGLKLGGETGVIVAKGTAEVNFVVKLTWKKPQGSRDFDTSGGASGSGKP